MSSDATTIPICHGPERRPQEQLRLACVGAPARGHHAPEVRVGGGELVAIVALSLFLVLITANRPSGLAPTTHTGFYPHWMAGPLGGLWPGLTSNGTTLRWHVHDRADGDVSSRTCWSCGAHLRCRRAG